MISKNKPHVLFSRCLSVICKCSVIHTHCKMHKLDRIILQPKKHLHHDTDITSVLCFFTQGKKKRKKKKLGVWVKRTSTCQSSPLTNVFKMHSREKKKEEKKTIIIITVNTNGWLVHCHKKCRTPLLLMK